MAESTGLPVQRPLISKPVNLISSNSKNQQTPHMEIHATFVYSNLVLLEKIINFGIALRRYTFHVRIIRKIIIFRITLQKYASHRECFSHKY